MSRHRNAHELIGRANYNRHALFFDAEEQRSLQQSLAGVRRGPLGGCIRRLLYCVSCRFSDISACLPQSLYTAVADGVFNRIGIELDADFCLGYQQNFANASSMTEVNCRRSLRCSGE